MINWIVIIVLIVIGIIAIKMNHLRHKIFIVILIFFALFLYVSISVVTVENDLELNSAGGIFYASKVYSGWLANGFDNLKAITGNAIKMDWKSTDAEFINKTKKDKK